VRCFLAFAIASAACLGVPGAGEAPQTGITAAPQIARAYDLILDADFDQLDSTLPSVCPPAPTVACQGLEALGLWWRIQLDPDNRSLDAAFLSAANTAIAEAKDSAKMGTAMKLAIQAGRLAFLSGRMDKRLYASASSPLTGVLK